MEYVGSESRSPGQMLGKHYVCSIGHILIPIIMKLDQHVCLDEISHKLKMGHVGSETRSLGQLLEKPCVRSRGHIFSPVLMKLGQNLCLDGISDELKIGSCGFKKLGYQVQS